MNLFDRTPKRALAWAAVMSAGCLAASAAAQSAAPAPGLLPGEEVVQVERCGVILKFGEKLSAADKNLTKEAMRKWAWAGQCVDGLLNGPAVRTETYGALGARTALQTVWKSTFIYGRDSGKGTSATNNGATWTFYNAPSAGSAGLLNTDETFAPSFASSTTASRVLYTSTSGESLTVYIDAGSCSLSGGGPGRCRGNNTDTVYSVVTTLGPDSTKWPRKFCPNPRNPAGCEPVWREAVAPIIPKIKAVIAGQIGYEAQLRADAPALFAAWDADYQAKQRAAAAVAATQAAEAAARADAAAKAVAVESARQAAVQARADAAFQAKLKTANAGELFALADELKQGGQNDQSRQALRSLVSRFPNSPLAPVAAQQMSGGAPSSSPSRTVATTTPARSGKSCMSIIYEFADAMNAVVSEQKMSVGSDLWGQVQFLRMANALPVCRGDTNTMTLLQQSVEKGRASCRSFNDPGVDCVNGSFNGSEPYPPSRKARVDEAYQRIVSANQSAAPAPPAPPSAAASICSRELAKWQAKLQASNANAASYKTAENGSGSKAMYQHAMWMYGEPMTVLKNHCQGQPQYSGYSALKSSYDAAEKSCIQLSSDNGQTCVPKQLY